MDGICSHENLYGHCGQYSTVPEHIPTQSATVQRKGQAKIAEEVKFSDSSACLGNIDHLSDRYPNRNLLKSRVDNGYIRQGLNVILIGATDSRKSYIANVLGTNARQF